MLIGLVSKYACAHVHEFFERQVYKKSMGVNQSSIPSDLLTAESKIIPLNLT
jgi:hypothetical protein